MANVVLLEMVIGRSCFGPWEVLFCGLVPGTVCVQVTGLLWLAFLATWGLGFCRRSQERVFKMIALIGVPVLVQV